MADFCPIRKVDHLELYVGNAKQAAAFYGAAFGFATTAYRGLETKYREAASYVLEQGDIRLVLTTAFNPSHPIAKHVCEHADGDTLIKFDERDDYAGVFGPGFQARTGRTKPGTPVGLTSIDHIVGNVELGGMDRWVHFFAETMGFTQLVHFDDEAISTEYSALMSKVMQDGTGRVKFPINEPATGKRKSQIQEYLEYYRGPGVQHIALTTEDIVATVSELRARGVGFLRVPRTYYEDLESRIGPIEESVDQLADLGIMADRDDEGYLLQIFSDTVEDRPTLFFEIIERHGAKGFGEGNFKSLFEAIEREQARRGNLV